VNAQLLVAYYDGAYGPTLRLATASRGDLVVLHALFLRLAQAAAPIEVDFVGTVPCQRDDIASLILRSVIRRPVKALELRALSSAGRSFVWSNVTDDWLECAEKLDPFLVDDAPGHQYLTIEGVDDALVEFCYKE
jgi:hypothetical protein